MKFSRVLLLLLGFSISAFGQSDYYWIGGSGNWSDVSHWATTSGGATTHSVPPTQDDNVYFDANSFTSGGQVVTLDDHGFCKDMSWSGATNFPTFSESANLFIYGSLVLSPDVSYDLNIVEFWSNLSGNTITSNGNSLGSNANVRFQGSGEWSLSDNFEANFISHQKGTFNTNNNNITLTSRFSMTGTQTRVLNLGSSTVDIDYWSINGTNITINAGTSTIRANDFEGDKLSDGPFTYYDVIIHGKNGSLENTGTFNSISFEAGAEVELTSGATYSVSNMTATGSKFETITLTASVQGSEATFSMSAGTLNASYLILQDIHATGGATFNADQSIDNGNNTGWNITPLIGGDYYWIGNGGDWSDPAHWATTSGGSTTHGDYPSRYDDVFFDANSFSSTGQTVLIDIQDAACHDMDWTGVTNNPTIESNYLYDPSIYGSATFTPDVIKDFYGIDFVSTETGNTITFSTGGTNKSYISFYGEGGDYTLLDSIYGTSLTISKGTLNTNDQPVYCVNKVTIEGVFGATINLGTSTVYTKDWSINNPTNLNLDASTSTISVTGDFDGEGKVYNDVMIDGTSDITGANTFTNLEAEPGSDLTFEAGVTQTITNDLLLSGTKANPITVGSTIGGSQATISKASGTVNATYLVLQDSDVTGGATFNATQTIDNGNNTGWNITGLTGSDYYWVGDGGNWSDFANHWVTTSGGATFHTEAPGILDNVIFDANSFSKDGETVTIDLTEVNFNDMDWSTVDQTAIFVGSGKTMNIYGSLTFSPNLAVSVTTLNFLSTNTETIHSYGEPGGNSTINLSGSGSWTMQSELVVDDLNIENGTFNTGGFDLDVNSELTVSTSNSKSINFGTSAVFARSLYIYDENTTLDASSATFTLSSSFTSGEENTGNNITFGDVNVITYNVTDRLRINENVTVNNLTLNPGVIVEIANTATLSVSSLTAVGTPNDPITIKSKTDGDQGTISMSAGTVEGDYLILQDNAAIGGAVFNAYNSENNGNVTGWTFHKLDQTITFDAISDKNYDEGSFDLTATATSGLEVSFTVVSGPITIDGTTVTITGTGLASIRANQAGNIDYNPAASVIQEFTILTSSQSITFDAIGDKTFGDASFTLSGTATSGLDLVYTVVSGPIEITGSEVTITGAGDAEIEATQPGDNNYSAATPVSQMFTINKATQSISFDQLNDVTLGEVSSIPLTASSTSGLAISFSVTGPASLSGSDLIPSGVGEVIVTASQPGNDNYEAAADVQQTMQILDAVTSLDEIEMESLKIYPLPANQYLNIEQQSSNFNDVTIYNYQGVVVYKTPLNDKTKINVFNFEPGVYILSFTGSDKKSKLHKVILNR